MLLEFIQTYAKELFALLVPAVTWLFNRGSSKRPKLIRGTRHAFTFLIQQPLLEPATGKVLSPAQTLRTASVVIHNTGGVTCTGLELVFNWKPMCINLWPTRHSEERLEADGRYVLLFQSLAPGEHFSFEILAVNVDLPALLNVRSDQCVAREVAIAQHQAVPKLKVRTLQVLALFGLATVAYIALMLLQFLLGTPTGIGA